MRNDSMHLFCALRPLLWVALDGTLEGLVKEPTEQFRLFGTSEGRGVEQSGILGATRCFDLVSHFPLQTRLQRGDFHWLLAMEGPIAAKVEYQFSV